MAQQHTPAGLAAHKSERGEHTLGNSHSHTPYYQSTKAGRNDEPVGPDTAVPAVPVGDLDVLCPSPHGVAVPRDAVPVP